MGSSESPPLKRQRRDSTSITNLSDVNWRNAICDALGIDNTVTDDELQESLICLQKAGLNMPIDEEPEVPEAEPHYKHLHRIHCAGGSALTAQGNTYEDAPITKSTDGKDIHLSANILITDFDRYIQRNLGISFIVIHEYFCCHMSRGYCQFNPIEPTKEWRESLFVASEYLYGALLKLNTRDTPSKAIPVFATGTETPYWDFWAFYNRPILQMLPSLCDGIEKKHASVFSEYFCKAKLLDFESTEKLITTGNFTLQSLGYLFIPGNVVVVKSPRGEVFDMCYELTKWPTSFHQWDVHGDNSSISSPVIDIYINIDLSSWQSDGNFMEVPTTYICKTAIGAKELPTTSLSIVPFACLAAEKRASLLRRGEMFWKCRKIHYVSYGGWDFEGLEHFENSRFVVDPSLSKACYRHNPTRPTEQNPELIDQLGAEAMKRAEPPGVNFLLTTPTFIWGFNMQDKLWKKLSVANVNNIDWDEKAFDNLVIDPDSKDPLYRVTCGDIGTKPEAVEQYLKKVLTLGKSWDCVVLLDEAEVFLQERSLEDIERNALVSVFLRNLEYYDGILILTSNRVATFDEGFRSRIQLAIHYPKLEQAERRRVWENFVNRLNDDPIASAEVDIRNLRSNLTELSKFNLNGREIRNAISVARPLVKSEERKVDFESLKKVIRVQQKFDAYMKDVNEGLDDEKVAREEGKR